MIVICVTSMCVNKLNSTELFLLLQSCILLKKLRKNRKNIHRVSLIYTHAFIIFGSLCFILWIYVINWGHLLLSWLVFLAGRHGSNKYSIYLSRNAFILCLKDYFSRIQNSWLNNFLFFQYFAYVDPLLSNLHCLWWEISC